MFGDEIEVKPGKAIVVVGDASALRALFIGGRDREQGQGSNDTLNDDDLAGLEYHGVAGSSQDCQTAVLRLLQYGPSITQVLILTHESRHALLLTNDVGDPIAIKSGFFSGHGGTGHEALSVCLALLHRHGAETDEILIDKALMKRLDLSGLTTRDCAWIDAAERVRPSNYPMYIRERHQEPMYDGTLWTEFDRVIGFGNVDPRLIDLALDFFSDPDGKLINGYRRLESLVRERTGLKGQGVKLFALAMHTETGPLTWEVADAGELSGRLNLFTGAFMALRNPRVHDEDHLFDPVIEFNTLNLLYRLEAQAIDRPRP